VGDAGIPAWRGLGVGCLPPLYRHGQARRHGGHSGSLHHRSGGRGV